jgi:hypothetical protein
VSLNSKLFIVTTAGFLLSITAVAQEKIANPTAEPVSYVARAQPYSPDQIKVLGTLSSGQTGHVADTSAGSGYRAFVFEGNGHDRVQITVTQGRAYVALADSTLMPITGAMGGLTTTLPYHGPDIEAFYILVKGSPNQRLAIHFNKFPATTPADATR